MNLGRGHRHSGRGSQRISSRTVHYLFVRRKLGSRRIFPSEGLSIIHFLYKVKSIKYLLPVYCIMWKFRGNICSKWRISLPLKYDVSMKFSLLLVSGKVKPVSRVLAQGSTLRGKQHWVGSSKSWFIPVPVTSSLRLCGQASPFPPGLFLICTVRCPTRLFLRSP